MRNKTIKDIHNEIITGKITITDLTKETIKKIKDNLKSNFLNTLMENEALDNAKKLDEKIKKDNLLYGIPYLTKDNISTKGIKTTGSSRLLENYIPPFDATITTLLNDSETNLLGKLALDELGMGGTGLLSCFGPIKNPFNEERIIGGSSSGSAYAVAKNIVPFTTGTDTGDSIRKPASFVGLVGFKPSYGAISRYGVLPYSPSLDHIGFFTNTVEDIAILCEKTITTDLKDFTSTKIENNFLEVLDKSLNKVKFGFLKEVKSFMPKKLFNSYEKLFNELKSKGHEVIEISFDKNLLDSLSSIYKIISFSEGVSSSSNLDGINIGVRQEGADYIEIMKNTRTKGFGEVVTSRFILGNYQLKEENQEELLNKAKKIRRLIKNKLDNIYENIDCLILPPTIDIPPLIKDVLEKDTSIILDDDVTFMDNLLLLANFNGMPSITLPFVTKDNLPIGINLNTKPKSDTQLIQIAKEVEKIITERGIKYE